MTEKRGHDRQSFKDQGAEFMKANVADSQYDYAANCQPPSFDLSGKTLTLAVQDAPVRIKHGFTEKEVQWEMLSGPLAGDSNKVAYEAFELAPEIFLISFMARDTESVAIAANLARGVATVVKGDITDEGVVSEVFHACIEEIADPETAVYHIPYSLGGTRFLNTYADNVAYEHIYLTDVYETWLGVKGPQRGQADTEEYHAFKIGEGLYFLYWNEKILTTQMTFLFNFFEGRCVGQVFGMVEGELVHNIIGAYTYLIHTKLAELPNVTRLDIYTGE